jgi:5-methylcytosine-specific restriction protein B
MLFDQVSLDNIKTAINDLKVIGIPDGFSKSKYYDVRIDGVLYPPKPIMAVANYYATGRAIENYFSGGKNTPCFKAFKRLGIEIVTKPNNIDMAKAFDIINEFLEQAKTGNLKTKHYIKSYKDTKVKVSFGQGVAAKIPWISFLKEPFTTSDGIYPVYLYYKSINRLILAYGRSESNKPIIEWNLNKAKSIFRYFEENNFEKPDRYGDSHIFKVYDVNELPNEKELNQDLDEIIEKYSQSGISESKPVKSILAMKFDLKIFEEACKHSGLKYKSELITRYISSLTTKPFVLLSGLSGSGKTKLAQVFAQWISQDKTQYCIVPVGADWTNREPLLGYVNAIENEKYIEPENGALRLILNANDNPKKPYFLILDEMNLSHVERYFADFLSVMESKDDFKLHDDLDNEKSGVPNTLSWPTNLFVVGTVNIDETTYMFSPKVLDRANVIEFRVQENEIEQFLEEAKDITSIAGLGSNMGESFVKLVEEKANRDNLKNLNSELVSFFKELQSLGAEFGYRTAFEIQTLFSKIDLVNPDYIDREDEKIDIAIMQKLLPKLHGSRRKLIKTLELLAQKCLIEEVDRVFNERGDSLISKENIKYNLSFEKLARMYKNVIDNGFTSYAEA